MSLNWDVRDIKDHETVTTDPNDEKKWHPVTQGLVWMCMFIDMNGITEKNIDEFVARTKLYEKVFGETMWDVENQKYVGFTREQIESHIGLRTNVSTESKTKFLNKLWKNHEREVNAIVRQH